MGGDSRPLLLHIAMIRIRTLVPDSLENHWITLIRFGTPRRTPSRYDLAITSAVANEPAALAQATQSAEVAAIVQGYTFEEPAIELGVLMENDEPIPSADVRIPLGMLNRHGLVAGATGTGKTKTLQLMAEQIVRSIFGTARRRR